MDVLPSDLLYHILFQFVKETKSILSFDTACCNRSLRSSFLFSLRNHQAPIIPAHRADQINDVLYWRWLTCRGMKIRGNVSVKMDSLPGIAKYLNVLDHITELRLSCSRNFVSSVSLPEMTTLTRQLFHSCPSLSFLDLQYLLCPSSVSFSFLEVFSQSTSTSTSLQKLILPHNLIEELTVFQEERIGTILDRIGRTLSSLELDRSGKVTMTCLELIVKHCSLLKSFHFSIDQCMGIDSLCGEDVQSVLSQLPHLEELTLISWRFTGDAMDRFLNCLILPQLKYFRLYLCRIRNISIICPLLKNCPHIESIDVVGLISCERMRSSTATSCFPQDTKREYDLLIRNCSIGSIEWDRLADVFSSSTSNIYLSTLSVWIRGDRYEEETSKVNKFVHMIGLNSYTIEQVYECDSSLS